MATYCASIDQYQLKKASSTKCSLLFLNANYSLCTTNIVIGLLTLYCFSELIFSETIKCSPYKSSCCLNNGLVTVCTLPTALLAVTN